MNRADVPRPCACTSVRKAARVLARIYDGALTGADINVTQLAVMRALLRRAGEPLTRVAEDLAMDRTSLYRALAKLKKQRWITLANGPDKRSRAAVVTKAGRIALSQADPGWAATQGAIVERFGRRQWQAFTLELQRLVDCAGSI